MADCRIVAVVYDGFQLLDLAGPADVFATAALIARGGYRLDVAAAEAGPVRAHNGVTTTAVAFDELGPIDTLLVTGGLSAPRHWGWPGRSPNWHRGHAGSPRCATARCCWPRRGCWTGAARPRTVFGFAPQVTVTFVAAFEAQPVEERVVIDGPVVTAAGVSAGIDMALTLLARLRDEQTAQAVQLAMEYDPEPPFAAGSPRSAPPSLADRALALIAVLVRTATPGAKR